MLFKRLFSQDRLTAVDFEEIVHCLDTEHYEQAAQLLTKAGAENTDAILTSLLNLARQICLSLEHYHTEIEWHRQAEVETSTRETEAKAQLGQLLKLVNELRHRNSDHQPPELTGGLNAPVYTNGRQPADAPMAAMRKWLRREPEPQPIQAVAPALMEYALEDSTAAHRLTVYCLGTFQVYRDDEPVDNWPGRKSTLILKYLLLHRDQSIHKETLMEQFWPDADVESARNNLNVAVYGLRQALRNGDDFSYVLFQNDCYGLNPNIYLWIDSEAFLAQYRVAVRLEQQGQIDLALRQYAAAELLYQGTFLMEDLYEDWIESHRRDLQNAYLRVLDSLSRAHLERGDYAACITTCNQMLKIDAGMEEVYCRLMRCYSRQGQSHLALRQYHLCLKALETELAVLPMPSTMTLYDQIRAGQPV